MYFIFLVINTIAIILVQPILVNAYDLNRKDFNNLPKLCRYVEGGPAMSMGYNKLVIKYGSVWRAMHHYCWGKDRLNKAMNIKDIYIRQMHIKYSIRDFDYVINRASPSFELYPMLLITKGNCLEMLGETAEAFKLYVIALKSQPKYVDTYIALCNLYLNMGYRDKAIAILKKGIKNSDSSEKLKILLKEIKGK